MNGDIIPAPCRPCQSLRPHFVRGEHRRKRSYADKRPEDWIEEAWFILECRSCRTVQFASRWFGSVEQSPAPPGETVPLFYDWTGYVAGESWHQFGDEISE